MNVAASSLAAPGLSHHGGEEIDYSSTNFGFWDVIRIARKHVFIIFLTTICVVVVTVAFIWLMPVSYSASAEVVFDPRTNRSIGFLQSGADPSNDALSVQNQIHVIGSRKLAARVIRELDLGQTLTTSTSEDRAIDRFLEQLSVQPLGLSTTIAITFTTPNAQIASSVANAVADDYIDNQIDSKSEAARVVTLWLVQRVQKLATDTQKAEAAVQDYKRINNLSDAADGTPLVDLELSAVQSQLIQARAGLAEKTAIRQSLRALSTAGAAANLSQMSDSPVIIQLRQQEADVMRQQADLGTRYGPKNPKLIAMSSELKNIEDKISDEIDRVKASVESDVVVAQAQVSSLQFSLEETERRASDENMTRAALQSLEANAKSTRSAYEAVVSRLREVQGQSAMQLPDATIISRAPVPDIPNPPSRLLIGLGSLPAGFMLGLLIALFQERAKYFPLRISRGRPSLHAPVLARIPDLARQGLLPLSMVDAVVREPTSSFARAMVALEEQIARGDVGSTKVIGFTSLVPSEGKAVIALSVARAAARRGLKVVLIDGDSTLSVARILHLESSRAGFSSVLTGRTNLKQCVVNDAQSNVMLLCADHSTIPPDSLLGSPRMEQLIQCLRRSCDLVILNLPDAAAMPALGLIEKLTDGVVLLLGWGGSPLPCVQETNAFILALGKAQVGVVLAT